jgi:hypothetical protein
MFYTKKILRALKLTVYFGAIAARRKIATLLNTPKERFMAVTERPISLLLSSPALRLLWNHRPVEALSMRASGLPFHIIHAQST